MSQEPVKQYVCTEFVSSDNLLTCTQWQPLNAESQLPLTKSEADQITIAIAGILVLVWGFKQIKRLIKLLR